MPLRPLKFSTAQSTKRHCAFKLVTSHSKRVYTSLIFDRILESWAWVACGGSWTLSLCKHYQLFQLIWMATSQARGQKRSIVNIAPWIEFKEGSGNRNLTLRWFAQLRSSRNLSSSWKTVSDWWRSELSFYSSCMVSMDLISYSPNGFTIWTSQHSMTTFCYFWFL